MKEIGGYIELDTYRLPMLYDSAIKLNCARNAFAYLVETNNIKKILFPKFMCSACDNVFIKYGITVRYYSIDNQFRPCIDNIESDEFLYIVNFYGQLSNNDILQYKEKYQNIIIIDNSQAYFQEPIEGINIIYNCRKYFGVPDGALLFDDKKLEMALERDFSYNRFKFLLGRYEKSASEFYNDYVNNNKLFANESIKKMSRLTENLLHGIDYEFVKKRRTDNFDYLHNKFKTINELQLTVPDGAYMYPLLISNGANIRKQLQKMKIYIPTLWPAVFQICEKNELEYRFAEDILPLPVDQRYSIEDMEYIYEEIVKCINLEK